MGQWFWNNDNKKQLYVPNMETTNKEFLDLCKASQKSLKKYLVGKLKTYDYDVIAGDGYILAEGDIPVCLTAHMDTVHDHLVKEWDERNGILRSPQGIGGDDRCGIYMILQILKTGLKPYILFCEDEEIGLVGSEKFCQSENLEKLSEIIYLIELDRANINDAVYYHCGNETFKNFIKDSIGYTEAIGSCSDISNLMPALDRAGVNLSCGYYNQHTTSEYVVLREMERTIQNVIELLSIDYSESTPFEYCEEKYRYKLWDDDLWNDDYWSYSNKYTDYVVSIKYIENGEIKEAEMVGVSYEDCVGQFLMYHPDMTYNNIVVEEI